MSTITTGGETQIYFKDWGEGQPIVFSHGWPLSADAFEDQMFFLASHGYRCIAHDRRGHGRSSQPWNGNLGDDGYSLQARLNVILPGLEREVAQTIMDATHEVCPYSKATEGNMNE